MRQLISIIIFGIIMTTVAFAQQTHHYKLGDADFYTVISAERGIPESNFVNSGNDKNSGWNASTISYFILKENKQTILFDSGLPGMDITGNIAKVGVEPGDVTKILLTHMHGDHIGGLIQEHKALFPNAELYIAKEEADYWTGEKNAAALEVLKLYSKKLILFPQNTKIGSVESVPAFGHTPGHTAFKIGNLMVWGDIIHAAAQFSDPEVYLVYDVDPKTALATRKNFLEGAAKNKYLLAGMHLVNPAIGRVEKSGDGYKFVLEKGSK